MKKYLLSLLVLTSAGSALNASSWLSCPVSKLNASRTQNLALATWVGMLSVPGLVQYGQDLVSGEGELDAKETVMNVAGSVAAAGFLCKFVTSFIKK